jgi:hypothetical protein
VVIEGATETVRCLEQAEYFIALNYFTLKLAFFQKLFTREHNLK